MLIEKAWESLQAAELCFGEGLFNSTASRAYYAMFQATIVALERAGILPVGKHWSHEGVQAMKDELDHQVQALIKYIYTLAPEVRVEREDIIYEDEHANLKVYPPLDWDEDRCLELQHKIAERSSDIHLESGYLILVYVYTPEEQIFLAQRELEQARQKQRRAEKVLSEAQQLGLYRPTGVD